MISPVFRIRESIFGFFHYLNTLSLSQTTYLFSYYKGVIYLTDRIIDNPYA